MAKVKFLLADIKGKVGGLVFQGGSYGDVVRRFSMPVLGSSVAAYDARSDFASLSRAWGNELSAAQRTSWELLADTVENIDSFGDDIGISGKSLFIRQNMPVLLYGDARIDAAPANFDVTTLTEVDIPEVYDDRSTDGATFGPAIGAGERVIVKGIVSVSPAVTNAVPRMVRWLVSDKAATSPITMTVPVAAGIPVAGERYVAAFQVYNSVNGSVSPILLVDSTISAAP